MMRLRGVMRSVHRVRGCYISRARVLICIHAKSLASQECPVLVEERIGLNRVVNITY